MSHERVAKCNEIVIRLLQFSLLYLPGLSIFRPKDSRRLVHEETFFINSLELECRLLGLLLYLDGKSCLLSSFLLPDLFRIKFFFEGVVLLLLILVGQLGRCFAKRNDCFTHSVIYLSVYFYFKRFYLIFKIENTLSKYWNSNIQ